MMSRSELLAAADLFRQREKLAETRAGLMQMVESAPSMELRDVLNEIDDKLADLEAQISTQRAEVETTIRRVTSQPARTILRLRLIHGFTWKEVGASVGITANAARSAAYRALNDLFPDEHEKNN